MRILILGGNGMLAHRLFQHCSAGHDTHVTLRGPSDSYQRFGLFDAANAFFNVDVRSTDRLLEVFSSFRPDAVINGVGITHENRNTDALLGIEVNALLPHRMARMCAAVGARFLQISTDCVFAGTRGNYSETDAPDAGDLYGRTKLLGEVDEPHCLTLRTSIIGCSVLQAREELRYLAGLRCRSSLE